MSKNLVMVFTRNPELGKVKTRLAKSIGEISALNIYKHLLKHTAHVMRSCNADKAVYYSVAMQQQDIWDNSIFSKYEQKGSDLGERMYNAFTNAFSKNYDKVVIIGSDLFDISVKHLDKAFQELSNHDIVLGPAEDGGYYLLGMTSLRKDIFENKSWGTDSVLNDTLDNLKNESVFLLEQLNDIDTYDDLKNNDILKSLILND